MSELRALDATQDGEARILKRIHEALDAGRRPVLVTLRRPVEDWRRRLQDADIDPTRLFFIDATTRALEGRRFMGNVLYVGGPAHLEAIAMRSRLVCRQAPSHVLLDSVDQLAAAMGEELAQVFCHAMVNDLRRAQTPGDFILAAGPSTDRLREALRAVVDA
ncbi:MAG: DUF7504 family protein [Thermoplasmatota archaeon]